MKSNVRCWTPPAAALGIAMVSLSGCAMGGFDVRGRVCPPVVEYGRSVLDRAAQEVESLPEGAVLTSMLSDYAVMRAQARVCADS